MDSEGKEREFLAEEVQKTSNKLGRPRRVTLGETTKQLRFELFQLRNYEQVPTEMRAAVTLGRAGGLWEGLKLKCPQEVADGGCRPSLPH